MALPPKPSDLIRIGRNEWPHVAWRPGVAIEFGEDGEPAYASTLGFMILGAGYEPALDFDDNDTVDQLLDSWNWWLPGIGHELPVAAAIEDLEHHNGFSPDRIAGALAWDLAL